MASEVIAYVAVSLDGYIAAEGGSVDFLTEFGSDEYGYDEFIDSVGAVVMGSTTYEQILAWGWPYGDTPGLVLTTRTLEMPEEAKITFSSKVTGEAIAAYANGVTSRLWVVGGGDVISAGLSEGAIDTLEMYVMPVVLGSGVPLFAQPYEGPLDLVESIAFSNGVVKLLYSTRSRHT
ncbi:MAG: dihydrofolate reductase family protein [Acidimicrobiia bacterium]|nr:MAG: dihydrofolate reductase family protein [Acidimicrobiia bacterium]